MRKYFLCVGVLFSVIIRLQAGSADSIAYPRIDKSYIKSYWYDSKAFVISPSKWQKKQWIEFGIVSGAGLFAYTQDDKIQEYFVRHPSRAADNFSKYVFEPFGRFAPVLIGGLYLGGRLVKDNRLAGTSLTAAKALVVSSVFAATIKQITHRHRPYQDDIADPSNWDGPFSSYEYTSFPSGHSIAAFSMATVYAMEYRSTIWVPVLAYTLATGTAVSRLYDNKHWASDVLIGSALGFVTGRFIWKQSRKSNRKLVVLPYVGSRTASLIFIVTLSEP